MDAVPFTTRLATDEDSEFVYRLRREALGPYVEATWGWDEAYQRQLHDRRFSESPLEVLLVGTERIGCCRIDRAADEILLVSIYLHPEWQSKGIGSRILASLVEEATAQGVPIRLTVLRVNERAVALYERFGFEIVDTTETHHWMRRA